MFLSMNQVYKYLFCILYSYQKNENYNVSNLVYSDGRFKFGYDNAAKFKTFRIDFMLIC